MIKIDLNHIDVEILAGIRCMRELGFTEEEIQEKYNEQIAIDKIRDEKPNK